MDDQELEARIEQSLEEGYSEKEIIRALKEDGYSDERVKKVMEDVIRSENHSENEENDIEENRNDKGTDEVKNPEKFGEEGKENSKTDENGGKGGGKKSYAGKFKKRSPIKVVLFSILSLGLYSVYWFYQSLKQALDGTDSSPKVWLLLLMVPLVNLYIFWKYLVKVSRKGGGQHSPVLVGLLWLVLTPAGFYLVQKDLNHYIEENSES